jgi:hypothetical protein
MVREVRVTAVDTSHLHADLMQRLAVMGLKRSCAPYKHGIFQRLRAARGLTPFPMRLAARISKFAHDCSLKWRGLTVCPKKNSLSSPFIYMISLYYNGASSSPFKKSIYLRASVSVSKLPPAVLQ